MARVLAASMVVVLMAILGGDEPARASSPEVDPPLLERDPSTSCCMPAGGYQARTHFVTELFRSVEEL
jgi:hypothetical protein